ncbi:response regulator transcription factor [Actinomadura rupiterrae]|uniref:response regulator transcription factor n=1 Tax=Actinomadura rupiterrae TaxID=559627 RepID=UPI0020A2EB90|nr:response regulator transcription factor [Actinomadura rupiterrae]MCP2337317.1 two-component system response regulator MprA [Actinomadura rupiterrae]
MACIVVCEDDAAVRDVLKRVLEHDGHTVAAAATAGGLLRNLEPAPDLVVLDLGLPDADGRDVCLALRARLAAVPVLMLTALDGVHHKVGGFEAGADDYVTKPFDVPELLVRVRALLRRTSATAAPSGTVVPSSGIVLDPAKHAVIRGSVKESLTPTEFRLLGRLIASQGEAVRRHALVAAGWPHGAHVSDNTLDSFVRRLRTKLGALGAAHHLVTVRGVGYRWE